MSRKYITSKDVPIDVIAERLKELSYAITKGEKEILRQFGMRIPAEVDYDADFVLAEAAKRLKRKQWKYEKPDDALNNNTSFEYCKGFWDGFEAARELKGEDE